MSAFYGQVEGQAKTIASRRGSANSHIKASVQSWNGSIITELYYVGDELCIEVQHADGSAFRGYTIFDGTMDDFVAALRGSENE